MRYTIYNIDYDEGHGDLPKEITVELPDALSQEELEQTLSDRISEETGFCHKGFMYRTGEPMTACPHCRADLTQPESVTREYANKDTDSEEGGVFAHGHYENDVFESDRFSGFGGGRFDLLDNSDTCSACDGQL